MISTRPGHGLVRPDPGPRGPASLRTISRPKKVLAVDSQPLFLSGLAQCVRQRLPWLHWVGAVLLPGPIAGVVSRMRPNLLVVNAASVGMRRATTLARVVQSADAADSPGLLFLMAPHWDPTVFAAARAAGADGLTLVTDSPTDLATAIERTLHDREYVSPTLRPHVDVPAQTRTRTKAPRLTAREREVLALIAEGLNTDKMAVELGVGRETVRTHIRALLRKLDAEDRAYAVAKAFRFGLLD